MMVETHSYMLSPFGPALQLAGGSRLSSANSFCIRLALVDFAPPFITSAVSCSAQAGLVAQLGQLGGLCRLSVKRLRCGCVSDLVRTCSSLCVCGAAPEGLAAEDRPRTACF